MSLQARLLVTMSENPVIFNAADENDRKASEELRRRLLQHEAKGRLFRAQPYQMAA